MTKKYNQNYNNSRFLYNKKRVCIGLSNIYLWILLDSLALALPRLLLLWVGFILYAVIGVGGGGGVIAVAMVVVPMM